ncbi:hypothetical protein [Methylobacterium mesophilicum]
MEYVQHVLDRKTGELIEVSSGNWITITELGEAKCVTPHRVRTVLRAMDFLYVEGGRAHNRHRLMPWVIQQGYGKHVPARKPVIRFPFDVVSPAGQAWIEARWSDAVTALDAQPHRPVVGQAREALATFVGGRLGELDVHGRVLWLRDHFPALSDTEVASILDVTQQLVSRYARLQERQRQSRRLAKTAELPDLGMVRLSQYEEDETMASGGARSITQAHNTPKNVPSAVSDQAQHLPALLSALSTAPQSLTEGC